jgi:hypothetical protein
MERLAELRERVMAKGWAKREGATMTREEREPVFQATTKSLGPYGLREEARKSWDHIITNRFVYGFQIGNSKLDVEGQTAKDYLDGRLWFELHFSWPTSSGSYHYVAIVERVASHVLAGNRNGNRRKATANWNFPMLVDITKLVELPKSVVPVGVPSVVRLKQFDDCYCIVGDVLNTRIEAPFGSFGLIGIDRETCALAGILRFQESQLPSQMVQGPPQADDEISCNS